MWEMECLRDANKQKDANDDDGDDDANPGMTFAETWSFPIFSLRETLHLHQTMSPDGLAIREKSYKMAADGGIEIHSIIEIFD